MRFFEDGPDIPDELLHQCDRGQVVSYVVQVFLYLQGSQPLKN
jgi:hypothetical protein